MGFRVTALLSILSCCTIALGDGRDDFVPVETTRSGTQGEFLLNGRPFLPLVMTMLENNGSGTLEERLSRAATAGFNTVQISGSLEVLRRKLDLLESHALYGRVALFGGYTEQMMDGAGDAAHIVRNLRQHGALLGWELQDELNQDPDRFPPHRVRSAYEALRNLDPRHVVWLNLTQFAPDGPAGFAKWGNCADVLSNDNYPFTRGGELAAYHAALNWVAHASDGVAATYLQLSQFHPEVGPPTTANLRMMAYLAVMRGHRALSYFGYAAEGAEIWRDHPLLWRGVAELNAELTRALPMLLALPCDLPLRISLEGAWRGFSWKGEACEPLVTLARQIGDDAVACFLVGFPAYEAEAQLTLDTMFPWRRVTRWPSGEAVQMQDNVWRDSFYRGEVRVYLFHR